MSRQLLLVLALVMSTFAMTDDDAVATIKRVFSIVFLFNPILVRKPQIRSNYSHNH